MLVMNQVSLGEINIRKQPTLFLHSSNFGEHETYEGKTNILDSDQIFL